MDTFDTSEEVMSEIDIETTEVDFGENFEFGVNDQERENNNEQEDNIDGEKGEKNTEDEKLEEKGDLLMQSITDKRGATSENSKVEIDRTLSADQMRENILNSGMNLEQQKEELERLDNILANPEEVYMFPDYIIKETEEIKITSIAAMAVDGEGNVRSLIVFVEEIKEKREEKPIDKVDETKVEEATLNLELNIDIDKQEEVGKETLLEQSLLAETEVVNEEEVEQAEEIIQAEEENFATSEVENTDVEQVISVEETQSELISSEEHANVGNTHYVEQLTVDAKEYAEQVITERIIDLLKEEPQAEFVEEANTVVSVAETEQTFRDTQERTEPLVVTVEDKTEKVQTLEDRIIELLRDEDEPIEEIASEQVQTSEVENIQQEQVAIDIDSIIEISTTTETMAEAEITLPSTFTTTERSAVSNDQVEQVVINTADVEIQTEENETIQASHTESIEEQTIEQVITKEVNTDIEVEKYEDANVEQARIEETIVVIQNKEDKNTTLEEVEVGKAILNETIDVSKETSMNLNQEVEQVVVNVDETTERNSIVEEIKAEEKVVEKVQSSDVVDVAVEAVVNTPQEINKAETILSEVPVAEGKEVKSESNVAQEVVANNIQAQDIAKAETVSYVAGNNKTETQNVRSINIAEKADQHIESPVVVKGEEKVAAETKEKAINPDVRKVDNIKPEKVILTTDKDIKIANTRESKVVAKEAAPEKVQVLNTKPNKEVKDNVLPFKTREAIVLRFNINTVNNTIRSEAPRSLEKPGEEKRTTEEDLKAKPLSSHEILLQILGISQNAMESRNAEPTNSRSVPNVNQEEQETKSTKSIPSMYQQRNLNGVTLKIAA